MKKRWPVMIAAMLSLCVSGCWPVGGVPLAGKSSLSRTDADQVFILRGRPSASAAFSPLARTRHCLIMVPGISSGDLREQSRFLSKVRLRCGADLAVFQHWGHADLTRKVASPLATARAASDLATLCRQLQSGNDVIIDILAHSAGTIIANKAAAELSRGGSPVRLRHVLFLGTPHDPDVDLSALMKISKAVLNIHSAYDKINRNVSGNIGIINALKEKPYWNLRMDTSLGGRMIRHYAFIEHTPENWAQYGCFLRTGEWLLPQALRDGVDPQPEELYRIASSFRFGKLAPKERSEILALAGRVLMHSEPEIRYYGALLLGQSKDSASRVLLKDALKKKDAPSYLRREIYQAFGSIANPDDLRYLQRARKTDPASGDVLRDVLRDWKRRRIRPGR